MGEMRKTYIIEPRYCKGCLKEVMERSIDDFMTEIEVGRKNWNLKLIPHSIYICVGWGLYEALKAECYNNEAKRFEFGKWVFADIKLNYCLMGDIMKINCEWEDKKVGPDNEFNINFNDMVLIKETVDVQPEKVIWNKPATIVYWSDGSKTVVKVRKGDKWDPEKGYAMCIAKRFLGLKKFYEPLNAWEEDKNVNHK